MPTTHVVVRVDRELSAWGQAERAALQSRDAIRPPAFDSSAGMYVR